LGIAHGGAADGSAALLYLSADVWLFRALSCLQRNRIIRAELRKQKKSA